MKEALENPISHLASLNFLCPVGPPAFSMASFRPKMKGEVSHGVGVGGEGTSVGGEGGGSNKDQEPRCKE